MKNLLYGLFLGSIAAAPVFAGGNSLNPVLDDPFTFRLGIAYLKADGTFSSTIDGGPTGSLKSSDLGVDDSDVSPYFGFRWRFADRWRLNFNYFGLDNSGSVRRNFDRLVFGDIQAKGFLEVDTSFSTDFYVSQVGYSFLKGNKGELGVGAGLHVVNFDTSLKVRGKINGNSDSVESDSVNLTVPLPNVVGFGTYAFTPRLSVDGNIGWFALDYSDYSGNLISAAVNLEYRLTDHFGIGAGYNYIDMDLTIDQSRRKDNYNLEYQGPTLYLTASF